MLNSKMTANEISIDLAPGSESTTGSLQPETLQLTPLMRQYSDIKKQHPDVLLFFRVGDFYELFDKDAVYAARLLDITLTSRPEANYPQGRMPMAGVPVRSVELYVAKLLSKGVSVAICEQVGVVGLEKGPVERQVARILTPGTVLESELLPKRESNYLACVVRAKEKNKGGRWGLAYVEASCAEFHICELTEDEIILELGRLSPSEILAARRYAKLHPDDVCYRASVHPMRRLL